MARQIDTAALESASWGAFQIMGYHWQRLGYASVQDFVTAMSASESQQFEVFTRFIETDPVLHKAPRKFAMGRVCPSLQRLGLPAQSLRHQAQRAYGAARQLRVRASGGGSEHSLAPAFSLSRAVRKLAVLRPRLLDVLLLPVETTNEEMQGNRECGRIHASPPHTGCPG